MADYKAVFAKPRRIASAISSYYVRTSNGTDRATSGTYSVVSSGTPAFDRKDGLILEAARTQLLYNTGFSGAASGTPGTTPTGWTRGSAGSGGTRTVTAIDLGNSIRFVTANDTDREYLLLAVTGAASTTYVISADVTVTGPNVPLEQMVYPSGSNISSRSARVDGVSRAVSYLLPVGTCRIEYIFTMDGTGGSVDARFGAGCLNTAGRPVTGVDVTISRPQVEAGAFRSGYIYNTNTGATLTRAASYLGPIPVGDMGIASQTNEYSFSCLVQFNLPSGVNDSSFHKLISLGATGSTSKVEIRINFNTGRVYLNRTDSGASTGESSTTAGEISWTSGQSILVSGSVGAINGLIQVTKNPSGTSYTDTNTAAGLKAAFPHALTHLAVNGGLDSGAVANNSGNFVVKGFRVWDTALTQVQLEALTTADLDGTTYLTSWATELGSDPPASVTISDEDITTGSLDWWRFGESADTSENTKSASYATYLSGSANINTPAFGRYSGSSDKQFPAINYTDGTSPTSQSATPRSYASTGVAGAGRRNVVTSQGKPLWIHILAGGYDGVHQHVCTTSDSSSPVHTRTNTTGATTVKAWETIIYWGGANGSTLQIDSTAVSGSIGLQLAAITVFPVDPTITSLGATAIDPGTDLTINHINFQNAPTSVTYASQTEAFTGSPTTTQSVMTGIPIGDFAPSQSHVATRMRANYTLTLSDGYESASYTVQVDPMVAATPYEDWSTKDATTWYGPTVPGTWQTGDEIYGYYLTGYGQVEAGTGWFSPDPLGLPAQGRLICYDISAGQWLAGVNTEIYTDGSTGAVEGIVMAVVRPIVKSVVEVIT